MISIILSFLGIVSIIVVDQWTKIAVKTSMLHGESITVIDGLFNLTYVKNTGVAFGMGANSALIVKKVLFLFLPVVACFWLLYLIWTTRNKNKLLMTAYSMIFAGAVGNLIDRFSQGFVVDFFDFYFRDAHFATFNVADSSITLAAILLIIDYYLEFKNKKNNIL